MSKHTTGDWHLRDEGGELYIAADRYICKIDDWAITGAGSGYEEENKKLAEERDANIKLITAAPELLAALKQIQQFDCGGMNRRVQNLIKEAIEKIDG